MTYYIKLQFTEQERELLRVYAAMHWQSGIPAAVKRLAIETAHLHRRHDVAAFNQESAPPGDVPVHGGPRSGKSREFLSVARASGPAAGKPFVHNGTALASWCFGLQPGSFRHTGW